MLAIRDASERFAAAPVTIEFDAGIQAVVRAAAREVELGRPRTGRSRAPARSAGTPRGQGAQSAPPPGADCTRAGDLLDRAPDARDARWRRSGRRDIDRVRAVRGQR